MSSDVSEADRGTRVRPAVPVARLVLGTMTFGDTVDLVEAGRMLDVARAHGVVEVDTANGYAGGASEEILGRLLDGVEGVRVATKVGIPHPGDLGRAPLGAPALRDSVEGSLRRLRRERVDLLYLHQPDRRAPLAETLGAVAELVEQGKVGALGFSNHAAWQVVELRRAARDAGAPVPRVGQQLYNLLARRLEEEYLEMAGSQGVETVVYNPLAGGLLTGRHERGSRPDHGRYATSRLASMYTERYWREDLFDAVTALSEIAAQAGLGLTEMSLRWLVHRPGVDAVLLGASTLDHLVVNLGAARSGPLPEEVLAACDAVGAGLRGPMPAYNR